jgi:hypothetical protein
MGLLNLKRTYFSTIQYYIIYSLHLNQTIVLIHVSVYSKHVKVIRCDIKPESVKKCRGVENEPISGKKQRVYPQAPYFLEKAEDIVYKFCKIYWL